MIEALRKGDCGWGLVDCVSRIPVRFGGFIRAKLVFIGATATVFIHVFSNFVSFCVVAIKIPTISHLSWWWPVQDGLQFAWIFFLPF